MAISGELRPTDRIDASEDGMESSLGDAVLDRLWMKSQLEQLPSRYDTVLASGQRP
jgi:hypothetical protein